ncbi:TPA: hypothetical protein VNQ84_000408 [Streptococcus pyogenes]|uniref:hypothetical protein n=1 Tax=Streptococcus phage phi3396 TaxID=423476 RepID=UPI0000F0E8E8|nr:hypothetical protein [Streptococcus sp. NCTC 11567]YP_001039950.1 hypothetical protein phi3396_63 [Streptococcus phage phi3396]KKC20704.1 hypothetical protein WH14_00350 [Streptococcus dysgalactiae subsp. equisimilis]QBX15046.1 hypothetical protein Javan169_0041 [Streptococcus phage Javan169]HEP3664296.1 hypothetical protein [Streptococcus pyogenes]ABN10836.1 hypothetical protein phi3396_63 [Streptococcus phage phi3396]VUD00245.1 Uncharacterised protein [Streptococcus sp. NCTC 11567]
MEINVTSFEMEKAIVEGKIEMAYSKRQGAWVAEIVGTHPTYKLDRKFIEADEDDGYLKTWEIEEGKVYCICPSTKYKDQYFVKLEKGTINELTKKEVEEMFN